MADALQKDFETDIQENQLQVRQMVLEGLSQAKNGQTKDFNEVCDRLEVKYQNATL